ncbi:hypothetical protein EG829_21520, partial [bacterium]|nr:hypothetical protein [bacterium]
MVQISVRQTDWTIKSIEVLLMGGGNRLYFPFACPILTRENLGGPMDIKRQVLFPALGAVLRPVFWCLSAMRLPQVRGTLCVQGLDVPAEVLRDRWGVPHIYAASMRAALFAQGFVHAQERLWQMDFTRRVVSGCIAEVLGKPGIPADRAMRTLGLRRTAEAEVPRITGEHRHLVDAYCAGINACIDQLICKRRLPLEFVLLGYRPEPWSPADSISWVKLMSWTLEGNWQSEFYRREMIRRIGAEKVAHLE